MLLLLDWQLSVVIRNVIPLLIDIPRALKRIFSSISITDSAIMQNNNPMGNPNIPPGGYAPPNQGQLHQQQPGMGYYGQPGPGQPPQQAPMSMQGQQMMMGGGSSGMSMGYQSAVPPMMPQQPVQPNPSQSMMQQAMFGAQGALGEQLVPYGCTRS